ncbi:MAG: hypothetical protein E8D51_02950 [Nitrospira sp.]|nr:MAG: hypothetical protein E8D51_02950 [Nitrospira sp.]
MTDSAPARRLTTFTLIVYWGCILLGLTLPLLATVGVDLVKHQQSLGQAFYQLRLHLFAPGYNLFLIAVMNAVPFILFAVFALFHLGNVPSEDLPLTGRRKAGVLMTTLGLLGLAAWTHVMTLWFPDAQGALAYVFLPFAQIIVTPVSYAAGRLLRHVLVRGQDAEKAR